MTSRNRLGLWLVGVKGSIGCTTVAGLALLARRLVEPIGLVAARSEFAELDLVPFEDIVVGGHDIAEGSIRENATELWRRCGFAGDLRLILPDLEAIDGRIGHGVEAGGTASDWAAVVRLRADLDAFKRDNGIERLVVVSVLSTERAWQPLREFSTFAELQAVAKERCLLPSSSLYAWAAFEGGDTFIDFTPNTSFAVPGLIELAHARGAAFMGSDGKTGETLIKATLVEVFERRNLRLLSWFGQNILGNSDGATLSDDSAKQAKVARKDKILGQALGAGVYSRVGIDYVPSLGEWKVAWDHIHFEGFLGCRMNLQFTWTGLDSALAAPLVLDLARLADASTRSGASGALTHLSAFFKDPFNSSSPRFVAQDESLLAWAKTKDEIIHLD